MRRTIYVMSLFVLLSAASCTQRLGDLSVMSNRSSAAFKKSGKRVKGEDCKWNVLLVPFGQPNLEEAVDDAMKDDAGSEALVDVAVRRKAWTALLFGQTCVEVEGTLAKDGSAATASRSEE